MKRLMYLVIAAAALTLGAGTVAAEGSTRPDDRATHGPGAIGSEGQATSVRPDDRATHGPGLFATDTVTEAVRPDDRAWRGVGPAPTIEPTESPLVQVDGFDWADAGIGALGAFGLGLLLAGASLLAVRRQRATAFS